MAIFPCERKGTKKNEQQGKKRVMKGKGKKRKLKKAKKRGKQEMKETFCCSLFVRKSNVALSFPLFLVRIVRRENEELQLSLSLSLLDGWMEGSSCSNSMLSSRTCISQLTLYFRSLLLLSLSMFSFRSIVLEF